MPHPNAHLPMPGAGLEDFLLTVIVTVAVLVVGTGALGFIVGRIR